MIRIIILEDIEQGKRFQTIKDALKQIAEIIALSEDGYVEAEEIEGVRLYKVKENTAFYLLAQEEETYEDEDIIRSGHAARS